VKVLMTRLAQGQMLKVEARRMTYTLPLQGFAAASGQFAACRQEAVRLQGATTGSGK
jgi:hypothetical protein